MKLNINIVCLALLLPLMSYGETTHENRDHENTSEVELLSRELRHLLSQEMKALENGMMSIIPAYNSGKWSDIETIARKMKNSYIFKQSLTESQIRELQSALPHTFVEKDQNFHYLAGMLEFAAKNKKLELINFYFSEMNRACVGCHTMYATHKFPGLLPIKEKDEHIH